MACPRTAFLAVSSCLRAGESCVTPATIPEETIPRDTCAIHGDYIGRSGDAAGEDDGPGFFERLKRVFSR